MQVGPPPVLLSASLGAAAAGFRLGSVKDNGSGGERSEDIHDVFQVETVLWDVVVCNLRDVMML